jgi:pyridinium-3,5-biscarboxylic acid mononucleotide sulfurtransferase
LTTNRQAITDLNHVLRRHRRAGLLFSGGVDSALVLAAAAPLLGPGLCAITFTGPHTVPGELAAAWALARRLKVRHLVRAFDPLNLPAFRHNTPERCYACKHAIITQAWKIAAACNCPVLWDGTNLDDLAEFRPGFRAIQDLGVESPLRMADLGKEAIRALSRDLGLDGDRASQSCLATRFPYNTELTHDDLARVGRGEAWLRRRGFVRVRLRVLADCTRLEMAPEEWPAFLRPEVRRRFRAYAASLGFTNLCLDGR